MARRNPRGGFTIAAGEVAAFSVCPQAWDLLWNKASKGVPREGLTSPESTKGQALHEEWSGFFEQSVELSSLIRYLAVLICVVSVFFIFLASDGRPISRFFELSFSSRGVQVLILIAIAFWLVRVFLREFSRKKRQAGFEKTEIALAIDGSDLLPEREYVSEIQGLAGRPDALMREGAYVIPIERKPLAKKLRDRYVAQLIVYMRLVEEFEGQRPPHGYLFLGQNCRRVKITNSDKRQEWVEKMLKDMQNVLAGNPPVPSPHPRKCAKCEARNRCASRADRDQDRVE